MNRVFTLLLFSITLSHGAFCQKPAVSGAFQVLINGAMIYPVDSSDFARYAMNENLPVYEIPGEFRDDTLLVRIQADTTCQNCETTLQGVECYFEGAGNVDGVGFTDSTEIAFPLEGVAFDNGYGESGPVLFYIFVRRGPYPDCKSRNLFILRLK